MFPRAYTKLFGLKILKLFDADPGPEIFFTLDPESGMKKFGSGIQDKHPGSATLLHTVSFSQK
jgi:hypothetical protein